MPIKPNAYELIGDVVRIDVSTTKLPNTWAVIDAADLDLVLDGRGRWFAVIAGKWGHLYVARHRAKRIVYLHRFLMGAEVPLVDHEDGDGLNNRRGNLRPADKRRNQHNSKSHADSASQFKGIYFRSDTKRWSAGIMVDGRKISLGCFNSEVDAARAYDRAAAEYFGAFAKLNLSESGPNPALQRVTDGRV